MNLELGGIKNLRTSINIPFYTNNSLPPLPLGGKSKKCMPLRLPGLSFSAFFLSSFLSSSSSGEKSGRKIEINRQTKEMAGG